MMAGMAQDHPIFTESIRRIRALLGDTGLQPLEQEVLERLVHSSGDPSIAELLRFSEGACEAGLSALQAGAVILTDTEMAAAAIRPMAQRTLGASVRTVLEWAPALAPSGSTRTAAGLLLAWQELAAARRLGRLPHRKHSCHGCRHGRARAEQRRPLCASGCNVPGCIVFVHVLQANSFAEFGLDLGQLFDFRETTTWI